MLIEKETFSAQACQCNFPSQLIGVWKGADRGDMTFVNSTYIQFYKVTIPGVSSFHFYCEEQNSEGTLYYLRAEQVNNIFGLIIKFYMCIELHVVDSDVAYYYQLTERDPYLQDNMVGDGTNTATFSSVCSRTLVSRTFITLVRDGSIADGSLNITCPDDLQAQFANVSIQHESEADASTCPDTVFDVCTDKTLINITYNETCSTTSTDKTLSGLGLYRCIPLCYVMYHYILTGLGLYRCIHVCYVMYHYILTGLELYRCIHVCYVMYHYILTGQGLYRCIHVCYVMYHYILTGLGLYRCIHAITDGSDTYLSIWNDDPFVTNPFYCLAFRRTGDTIYATETPQFCGNTTTSSEAETGGVKLVIWDIITTPEVPPNLAWLYMLLILPFILLLILAILLARYCFRKYGCICKKIKLPKRKKKPPPIVDDGTGKPDIVQKITFVPSVIKPAQLYNFRPKKPLNFFPLFDPQWIPSKTLQPIAKVEPLYHDTFDDYMKGKLPRRPSGVSLYSFHSGPMSNGNAI
ncbi:unnamed protein product [Mytilus coruscus]|uniref:Uncharacterized protein n=1 Tax=Mytilus coruscus TaxID=42192 RepID=A0A6J8A1Z2_MYTCO|nr:unnamed protein product [Mytilus coruscus]